MHVRSATAMGETGRTMTDLINRPSWASSPGDRRGGANGDKPASGPRPVSAAAAIGGLVAAVTTLAVCMSVGLTGWFLADAGAHGETTDALRVGADGWLLGHGSDLTVSGTPYGITPLAITMILVLAAFRAGRWCVRGAAKVEDDRTWAAGVATYVCVYLVLVVVVAVIASQPGATNSLPGALLGGLLVSGLAGGAGLAVGTGRSEAWLDRVPAWSREVVAGGIVGLLVLIAMSAALVAVSLMLSLNEAAAALSQLQLSTGDAVAFTAVAALVAPNAILFGSAYLLGPGFAVGAGTTVSPTAVSLGLVPAFPLLAALPEEGPVPGWLRALSLLPVLAAGVGVAMSRRGGEPVPYDIAAARGFGSGFVAGVLVTLAISLAGGPMGTGRLADIGAPNAEVLVFATGLMSVGGLLGGVLCTLAQRWRSRAADRAA